MTSEQVSSDPNVEGVVGEKIRKVLESKEDEKRRRLAIIASKGTLDMAYPPLILATTAAAMGWEVGIFCTFYGLDILKRKKIKRLKAAPLANSAMPLPVPNLIGALPGMTAVATAMMRSWMSRARIPTLEELLHTALQSGVTFFACTTTMGVMNVHQKDIIEGAKFAGAASFLDFASEANVTLFI